MEKNNKDQPKELSLGFGNCSDNNALVMAYQDEDGNLYFLNWPRLEAIYEPIAITEKPKKESFDFKDTEVSFRYKPDGFLSLPPGFEEEE